MTGTRGLSVLGVKYLNPQAQKFEVATQLTEFQISEPLGFKYQSGRQCHGRNLKPPKSYVSLPAVRMSLPEIGYCAAQKCPYIG